MSKIHRWQPIGKTACGLKITDAIKTNVGRYLSDGVTCRRCKRANMRWSILGDKYNGQSDGLPVDNTIISKDAFDDSRKPMRFWHGNVMER